MPINTDGNLYALAQYEREMDEQDRQEEAINHEAQQQLDDFATGEATALLGEETIDDWLNDSETPFLMIRDAWKNQTWEALGPRISDALIEYADTQLDHPASQEKIHNQLVDDAHERAMERGLDRMEARYQ